MADSESMDIGKCPESLVSIEFHQKCWNRLLHFVVVLEDSVDSLRDVIHDHIQVDFVLLKSLIRTN